MDRCQDAIVTEELDPGLFGAAAQSPQVRDAAIGAGAASSKGRSS
jgi:hypothetical protein